MASVMALPLPKRTLRQYITLYKDEHTTLGNKLTHMVGIPMIVASVPTSLFNPLAAGSLLVTGWALQFAGHYVFEGNKPAFFSDPYYLLVGPVWVATEWLELFGLPVPEALTPADTAKSESADVGGGAVAPLN
jgi:uncharacterized membrane protein YGL010W